MEYYSDVKINELEMEVSARYALKTIMLDEKQITERHMPHETCRECHLFIMNMFLSDNHMKCAWK